MTSFTLEFVNNYRANVLANFAGVTAPDSEDSPGAEFLDSVRDVLLTAIHDNADDLDLSEISVNNTWPADFERAVSEICDNAPSVYSHERMQQLVDLCAYNRESEFGGETILDQASGVLYDVARDLVMGLLEDIQDEFNQWATETNDESDDVSGDVKHLGNGVWDFVADDETEADA